MVACSRPVARRHDAERGDTMSKYATFVGLDVHARSVSACALDPMTGEVSHARLGPGAGPIAEWVLRFERPVCAYESGPTGWHLARELRALGVPCVVGASARMQRPPADRGRKTDRRDAEFLARLLSTGNVCEAWVPDEECEAARDLSRALEDARDDLQRARQRLSKFLLRHGHVYDEATPGGRRRSAWTRAHARWLDGISFAEPDDAATYEYYRECVARCEEAKRGLEARVAESAGRPRWRPVVDALRCLKGIDTVTAHALAAEVGDFSRFGSAPALGAWAGLVPSEHSSGETVSRGGITKAGNAHVRRLLVEAAWHVPASSARPKAPVAGRPVPPEVARHAAKGNRRLRDRRLALERAGKRPVVANCATAREMAGWVWALGRMARG